ncbi:MAG: ABC transporter ATP-binding protein [Firmicutes bacterium]|nr:ABC transporter ATP-binding protein [Bacillota bacterium]
MIEISNLTKIYKSNNFKAVDDISLTVNSGEIFGFLGPNGAGKSTTIKCITGILSYDKGSIRLNGNEISENPIEAKKRIGFVPDEHVIYDGLTGYQYINFICNVFGVDIKIREERIKEYAVLFSMEEKLKDKIASYSHGMKQKISLISALVHEPEIFILDEPMTGLDPQSSFNLKTLMQSYAKAGKTVFFSSHILEVVEKLCTKVAIINKGKIAKVFDLSAERGGKSLEEMFLEITSACGESAQSNESI